MTQRQRKFVGAIALIVFVAVYVLLAMAAAIVLQVRDAGKAAELVYYVVAGLAWVLPAGWLVWWMQRGS